jgi:hypothetical protein
MSDFHVPTAEEWEARVLELRELLSEARAHLKVARRAVRRRQEGPLLPGLSDQPPAGSDGLPTAAGEPEA